MDELTIPTTSPQADDFVGSVDNRWLPLAIGSRWTYDDLSSMTVTGTAPRAGIPLTELARVDGPTDLYAQDDEGNVWWFGRDEELFASPGLAMPAHPRRGDGFVMAEGPGLYVRAEVVALGQRTLTPSGSYDEVLVLRVFAGRDVDEADLPDNVATNHYAPGVGLVRTDAEGAASILLTSYLA